MEKLLSRGILILLLLAAVLYAAGAGFCAEEKVVIKKVKDAIKIDGKLDEWKDYPQIALNQPEQCTNADKDQKDFSSVCYVAWDRENLYFAADVKDDFISCEDLTTADFQHCDYYRFYIDAGNNREEGSTNMDGDDYEFVFTPTGPDGKPMKREVSKAFGGEGHELDMDKIKIASNVVKNKGWTLEVAIPWSLIGISPKEGTGFGIKFITGDTDEERQREDEYIWGDRSGNYWSDPTRFGSAILSQ